MATATMAAPGSLWSRRIWEDLQPTPGRLNATLRITLASIIALLVLMTLRMPFASIGLYFVFLVGRDSPAVSIRSSVFFLLALAASVAIELGVVIVTDNDPMARVVSVVVVTFLAGILMLSSTLTPLAAAFGFIFCTLIATWETHAPSDRLVKGSLWLLATAFVAQISSVVVEYLFGNKHPAEELQGQRRIRYEALETLFKLYAQPGSAAEIHEASIRVARLSVQGQAGMQDLYNKIVERNLAVGTLPIGTRVRITMLAQLVDLAATYALQNPEPSAEIRPRCATIAELCGKLKLDITPPPDGRLAPESGAGASVLDRIESTLYTILSMPKVAAGQDKEMVALPAQKVPILRPDLVRNKDTVAFALKISLCCTICYIVYHAVAWPGISTSVTTVLITGLSSSGAIKQKLIFRVLGSLIGGLIFGLGATVFLFPHMDSITSLVVLVAVIAFISAWCATGRRFNYVGLQIAFSFYTVAFEGFSAPTELAPARDRLIGILLALVVMAFVFDQIWPVRTVTTMRRALASVLHGEAELLRLLESGGSRAELRKRADALRDYTGKTIASLRTMAEAVDFEFGVNREEHTRTSQMIIEAALSAAALFFNQLAFMHYEKDLDFFKEPGLIAMRRKLAEHLDDIAESVVRKIAFPIIPTEALVDAAMIESARYGEYARNSVARYEDLQSSVACLSELA
jgi:multidrug resistance protein MdtO